MSRVSWSLWPFTTGTGMSWAMRMSRPWYQGSRLAVARNDLAAVIVQAGVAADERVERRPAGVLVGQGHAAAVDEDDFALVGGNIDQVVARGGVAVGVEEVVGGRIRPAGPPAVEHAEARRGVPEEIELPGEGGADAMADVEVGPGQLGIVGVVADGL